MGLDQSIKTTNQHIQDGMREKGCGLAPYAGIPEKTAFYSEHLSNVRPEARDDSLFETILLKNAQETIGEWRYCHFLHYYFNQQCQKRFGHGLDDNGGFLQIGAPDLSSLLTTILIVLEGFAKDEEMGKVLASSYLPNVDIVYADEAEGDYDEVYRSELRTTAEWIQALLSIPSVQIATFRYVYSY